MKFLLGIVSLVVFWFIANAIKYRRVEKVRTCPICGQRKVCSTHHVWFPKKRWFKYKKLRQVKVDLCQECHDNLHGYWYKFCKVGCGNNCSYRPFCCYSSFYTMV